MDAGFWLNDDVRNVIDNVVSKGIVGNHDLMDLSGGVTAIVNADAISVACGVALFQEFPKDVGGKGLCMSKVHRIGEVWHFFVQVGDCRAEIGG